MKNNIFNIAKKIAIVGLSLIMSIGSVDAIAFAQAIEPPSEIEEYVCVNPRYESNLSDNELEAILEEEMFTSHTTDVTYNPNEEALPTITDAAILVRDMMIARNEVFSVEFESTRLDFVGLVAEIFDLAVSEELANSTVAGDYLAWQYGGYSCSGSLEVTDNDTYLYIVNLKVSYYTTADEEKAVTAAISDILNEMDIDDLSQYEKIRVIYDYVCDVCDYDYSNNNSFKKFSAYGAIKEHTAVCQGYSVLFYRMCKEAGIDSRIIAGNNHSWNIVKIDNIYYNTDATWDDNYYTKRLPYQYFLTCNQHFPNHTRITKYNTKDFNNQHTMTNECYYDIHPELVSNVYNLINEQNNTSAEEPKVCKTHKGKLKKSVAATCTKAGYNTYACTECGAETTNTIPATGHKTKLKKTVAATCTKAGYNTYACTICGVETKTTIPATGHKAVKDKAVAATYANAGKTEGSHCSVCKKVLVAQKAIPKLTVKTTKLSSVTAKSKGFTVKWNKQTAATGYEIQYATDSKFTKNKKTVTVSKNSTTSKDISKLSGKKKYYVRIRCYKTENGKKYYSNWSAVKQVTTKK